MHDAGIYDNHSIDLRSMQGNREGRDGRGYAGDGEMGHLGRTR